MLQLHTWGSPRNLSFATKPLMDDNGIKKDRACIAHCSWYLLFGFSHIILTTKPHYWFWLPHTIEPPLTKYSGQHSGLTLAFVKSWTQYEASITNTSCIIKINITLYFCFSNILTVCQQLLPSQKVSFLIFHSSNCNIVYSARHNQTQLLQAAGLKKKNLV